MKKIYRRLTKDQKERGVIFSSTLSPSRDEDDVEAGHRHEVFKTDSPESQQYMIERLTDDRFFRSSQYRYNIIRS